jgi:DNA-binding transcriptional ArsR family regulator
MKYKNHGEAVEGEERGDHIGEGKHPPLLEILQIISKNKTPYFKTKNIRRYNTVELTPQHIGHIIKKLRKIGLVEIYRDHGRHYTYRRLFKPQDLPGIIEKLEEEGLYC